MKKTTRNVLSHTQFFKLCEWLVLKKEDTLFNTLEDVQKAASAALGFLVSSYALNQAIAATGADLIVKKLPKPLKQDRSQALASELASLMRELGKEPSPALLAIINRKGYPS